MSNKHQHQLHDHAKETMDYHRTLICLLLLTKGNNKEFTASRIALVTDPTGRGGEGNSHLRVSLVMHVKIPVMQVHIASLST